MINLIKRNKLLRLLVYNQVNEFSKQSNSKLISLLENMPKEPKHVVAAQEQRKKIKEKYSKFVPGRIALQVLGTGALGAPRSLYLFTDQSRYLFNCGEGTQRLAHEHKMKLAKLEHIFVTHKSWKNIGGLPGTALTIQDVGVPKITLHGPKGLEDIFVATKRFVVLRDLNVEMANCSKEVSFQDNVMAVTYVPIYNDADVRATNLEVDKDSQATHDASTGRNRNGIRPKTRSTNIEGLVYDLVEDNVDYYDYEPTGKHGKTAAIPADRIYDLEQASVMCYICKLTPRPGALSLEKCVKLGIQSGPIYGKLKMGQSVTLSSGITVHSKDVCEPDDPGPVFLVVDCPSEDYLDSFVTNKAFKKHQKGATSDQDLAYLVVHFTPPHIMNNLKYKQWVDYFSPSTQHLVLNESNSCMGSESVHRVQYQLNLLHEGMFPLLGDKGTKVTEAQDEMSSIKKIKLEDGVAKENSEVDLSNFSRTLCSNYTYANTFCNFHLRPKRGFDNSEELKLTPAEYIEEPNRVEGFQKAVREFKFLSQTKCREKKINQVYPRLVFLGTGSCIPNKTRNTSGILVQASDNTNILMDCGEGTYGQLVRFYGLEKLDQVLAKIKAIFISHLHADHHIGLIGLLQGRRRALINLNKETTSPLLLLAPRQILTWLNFYDKYFETICTDFELISNSDLVYDEHTLFEGTQVRIYQMLEMKEINTALVRHCPNAFGIAMTHRSGYKICYSGDTMPCENLIEIGQNCDVLIHEATMEDDLEIEAIAKMHSTTSQAVEVGHNMNAKNILLTHFSQRYAKLPRFNDNFGDNVGIAFDNMQIRYDDLPLVPLLYPPLKLMFAQHYEELENKAVKRQLRTERPDYSQNSSIQNPSSSVQNRSFCTTYGSWNPPNNVVALASSSNTASTSLSKSLKPPSNLTSTGTVKQGSVTLSPRPALVSRATSPSPSPVGNSSSLKTSPLPSFVSRFTESPPRVPNSSSSPTPINKTAITPPSSPKIQQIKLPLGSPTLTASTNRAPNTLVRSPTRAAGATSDRTSSSFNYVIPKRDPIFRTLATTRTTIPQLTITNQVQPPNRGSPTNSTNSTSRSPSPLSHLTIKNK